jgi:class 3 adenylate cyclase
VLKRFGVRSKLLLMLLIVSIGSVVLVSSVSYLHSRNSINNEVTDRLNAQRQSVRLEIETYFALIRSQAVTLSADRMVSEAVRELNLGWDQLASVSLSTAENQRLAARYEMLTKAGGGETSIDQLLPTDTTGQLLQYHYTVAPALGGADSTKSAVSNTLYDRAHRRYDALFQQYVAEFGFYDMFLIDATTGNVLYSAKRELDFGTNLSTGGFRGTNLARLFDDVRDLPDAGRVQFVDYERYLPSGNAPAAFAASPVIDPATKQLIGVLALQLPIDRVNAVTTRNDGWETSGLGRTGEVYLVGPDLTLRSDSRLLREDPRAFRSSMIRNGIDPLIVDQSIKLKSSILNQPVNTAAARAAIAGESRTFVTDDYRGERVLASVSPVDVQGLRWGIVAKQDLSEANQPVRNVQRDLLIATGLLVLLLTILAMVLSTTFVRPIEHLISVTNRVSDGELNVVAKVRGGDEFGELSSAFNQLVANLRGQQEVAAAQTQETDRLLESLMPPFVRSRMRDGERTIADSYPNVAVVNAYIHGFSSLSSAVSTERTAAILNEISLAVDGIAEEHAIEKMKTVSCRYIGVCGLSAPRVDSRRRAVDFAFAYVQLVQSYARSAGVDLEASIAVAFGSISGGVVGATRPVFEVWGENVELAELMVNAADGGTVVVDAEVRSQLSDLFDFVPHADVVLDGSAFASAVCIGRHHSDESRRIDAPAPDAPPIQRTLMAEDPTHEDEDEK